MESGRWPRSGFFLLQSTFSFQVLDFPLFHVFHASPRDFTPLQKRTTFRFQNCFPPKHCPIPASHFFCSPYPRRPLHLSMPDNMSAPAATRLYLVRHGEVESRYHKVFGGSKIDMELSPLGHQQVKAAADYFQRHPPAVMYASPMKRVQQTLAPLAQWTNLKPIVLPGLREVDFGAWTGLSWDQVYERFQISAFNWLDQLELGAIAEAESTADFRRRVDDALRQILSHSPTKEIAVIAHGGTIRMILALILDLPFTKMAAFDIEYASITKVKITAHKTDVELLNFVPWRDL
jgi:broad specificity phosphatase PhoE